MRSREVDHFKAGCVIRAILSKLLAPLAPWSHQYREEKDISMPIERAPRAPGYVDLGNVSTNDVRTLLCRSRRCLFSDPVFCGPVPACLAVLLCGIVCGRCVGVKVGCSIDYATIYLFILTGGKENFNRVYIEELWKRRAS